ncbi:MAG: FHA domain-containing protein [Planctomycetota bacterium]|nr:MAG: FHA domain-containing protein [Planctomycetota bacterium]
MKQNPLDDSFVRVFIEEMSGDIVSLSEADEREAEEDDTVQETRTAMAVSTEEAQPVEESPAKSPTVKAPPVETIPLEEPPVEAPTVEAPPVEELPIEELAIEESSVEALPLEEPPAEAPSVEAGPIPVERSEAESEPAVVSGSAKWQLRVIRSGQPECVLPLGEKEITIGRGTKNSLAVRCERISREHARIWLDESGPRIEDLNSANGTWVNGVKVPAAYLRANDIVNIGTIRIYIEQV